MKTGKVNGAVGQEKRYLVRQKTSPAAGIAREGQRRRGLSSSWGARSVYHDYAAVDTMLDDRRSELFRQHRLEELEEETSQSESSIEEAPDTEGPIRVLLADDHTIFRRGLAQILTSHEGMEVVGEVPNDEWTLHLSREARPDVVVTEMQMPFERAKEALRRMRSISLSPKAVIVTMFENPRYLHELMELGASAYLVKKAPVEHLIAAIRTAVSDPKEEYVVVSMPREKPDRAQEGSGGVLSAREMEILRLTTRGLSNYQMASRLHLAESTVKRHLANSYEKIGVHSRNEATRKTLTEGWITVQEVTE